MLLAAAMRAGAGELRVLLAEGVTQQFKLVILEQRFCFDNF